MKPGRYELGYGHGNITVTTVRHHRNGVGGRGFFAVWFFDEDRDLRLGIVPDNEEYKSEVMVIDPEDLANTLRGNDYYGDALRRACKSRSGESWGGEPAPQPESVTA